MGSGEKIGVITKLAKTGAFCKTWEGQIVRGGLNNGSGVMGSAFDFTIENEALATKVKELLDKQVEVKIFYSSEAVTFCRSDSQDHFLTRVELMNPSNIPDVSSSSVTPVSVSAPVVHAGSSLDRQKIAESIMRQNDAVIKQNQQLIDLLRK